MVARRDLPSKPGPSAPPSKVVQEQKLCGISEAEKFVAAPIPGTHKYCRTHSVAFPKKGNNKEAQNGEKSEKINEKMQVFEVEQEGYPREKEMHEAGEVQIVTAST